MRNNKMKGFTLVELLVVIAILAILATVSVVGYTSYIESTNITVDENLAAQLNRFLEAYKVNFTGDIDENNIREVTLEILKEGGLEGQLIAKSKDRDFFFDLQKDEYVLLEDEKSGIKSAGYKVLFGLDTLAAEEPKYEVKIENCFTEGNRYFYVGSTSEDAPISLIIDAFYKFNPDPANHKVLVSKINNLDIPALSTFVENAVVVTDECNYRLGENQTNVIFADGVNMIGTVTKAWNGTDWTPVTGEYVLATLAGKLTIPGSVKFFAEDALNLGADGTIVINKTARDVAYMSNANFANDKVTLKLTDGEFYTLDSGTGENVGKPVITNGTVEYLIQYSNPMVSFDIYVGDANNIRNIYTENGELTNSANVAWELNSFDLLLEAVGEDSTIPATHKEVTWSVVSGTGVTFSGNKATFASTMANVSDTIVIKATSNTDSNVSQTFTINVGKTTAATINFAYKDFAMSSTNNKVTFVYDAEAVDYAVTVKGNVTNNTAGTALTLKNTLAVTLSEGSTGITLTNNTAKVTGAGSGTITVKIGPYLSNTISYEIIDASQFTVKPIKNDILVGNGNTINVSDLFTGTIPSGAELRLYNTPAQDDDFMVPKRTLVPLSTTVGTNSVTMGAVANTITNVAMNSTIKFDGTRNEQVYLAFFVNGTRVSNDLRVTVVNGNNVRTWNDIKGGISANTVLLNNITFDNNAQLSIAGTEKAQITFYGNSFTLDVRNAKKNAAEHIISLTNATLDGVNIVGSVYSTFTYQDHYATDTVDSTSIVVSNNATIKNCYIANGRAPVRVKGDTTIENSIIFGGKFCNIDISKGVLKLSGNVTTINQLHEGSVGAGIIVDLSANTNYVKLATDCNLTQYNFVAKSDIGKLPKVSISVLGKSMTVSMSTVFNSVLTTTNDDGTKKYGEWIFEKKDNDGKVIETYLNAGIVYLTATGETYYTGPGSSAYQLMLSNALKGLSTDNRDSGSNGDEISGYKETAYTEKYDIEQMKAYVYANAHISSPVSKVANGTNEDGTTKYKDSDFVSTWFAKATNADFMAEYDPSKYVTE